ncbi:MAG: DUF4198 domain-containing protein [Bryobacteraceae bacterium]|nr:DUF4198 domain-containing protein [Bryobacteraceae bacterium]
MILVAAVLLAPAAEAHRMWLLPSSTVLSGTEAWVTIDAAVSNTLFVFEHRPLRLDGIVIEGPGGRRLAPSNLHTGQFRSSFDLKLDAAGTYRISVVNRSVMASWKENGEIRRWRGSPEQMSGSVPSQAEGLQVSRMEMRVETYVTLGKPSRDVLRTAGAGLEILPETHPNDLVAGEEAVFVLVRDGAPAPGTELTVALGAGRHAEKPFEQKLVSGPDGRVRIRFPAPGYYWLQATAGEGNPQSGGSRATCVVTLEVLPQ